MKHLFIINPVAGKGKPLQLIPEIKKCFQQSPDEVVIETTEYPGHATEIASRYVQKEKTVVYSVGGDGTLNEVLNGMVHSSSTLAVIPGGSGNDFFRSLSPSSDMRNILLKTLLGKESAVDIARANGRYYLNISSIGFDAEVALNTNRYKKLPGITGSFAYILGILFTLYKYQNKTITLSIDGLQMQTSALLTAIANGKYYGGGMMAAPEARLDDGLFDICLIKAMSKLKILILLPQFMKGKHGKFKEVAFYRGKQVQIQADTPFILNMDGEISSTQQVTFDIIPKGIKVMIPAK